MQVLGVLFAEAGCKLFLLLLYLLVQCSWCIALFLVGNKVGKGQDERILHIGPAFVGNLLKCLGHGCEERIIRVVIPCHDEIQPGPGVPGDVALQGKREGFGQLPPRGAEGIGIVVAVLLLNHGKGLAVFHCVAQACQYGFHAGKAGNGIGRRHKGLSRSLGPERCQPHRLDTRPRVEPFGQPVQVCPEDMHVGIECGTFVCQDGVAYLRIFPSGIACQDVAQVHAAVGQVFFQIIQHHVHLVADGGQVRSRPDSVKDGVEP